MPASSGQEGDVWKERTPKLENVKVAFIPFGIISNGMTVSESRVDSKKQGPVSNDGGHGGIQPRVGPSPASQIELQHTRTLRSPGHFRCLFEGGTGWDGA